ncbi:MAG: GTPase Era [Bacteroidota bacterium]
MNDSLCKSGFIHLLGKPNAGKSTLFNHLIKVPLAITSPKAQTTRQTLIGIDHGRNYQAIYVDTPGHITPAYPLQEAMMRDVTRSLPGSDLCSWVVDINDEVVNDFFPPAWQKATFPCFLLINKRDLLPKEKGLAKKEAWEAVVPSQVEVRLISALCKADVKALSQKFRELLPIHPPYYDEETLTNRPRAFVLAEMVRKQLLLYCHQEIPYSAQVEITQLTVEDKLIRVAATIYVERESQKSIVISQLKAVGTAARVEMEDFLQQKVFLQQHVKVAPKWRHQPTLLEKWGYT